MNDDDDDDDDIDDDDDDDIDDIDDDDDFVLTCHFRIKASELGRSKTTVLLNSLSIAQMPERRSISRKKWAFRIHFSTSSRNPSYPFLVKAYHR